MRYEPDDDVAMADSNDAVESLHDISNESEDDRLVDLFVVDEAAAEELGLALDPIDGGEPLLY